MRLSKPAAIASLGAIMLLAPVGSAYGQSEIPENEAPLADDAAP